MCGENHKKIFNPPSQFSRQVSYSFCVCTVGCGVLALFSLGLLILVELEKAIPCSE